MLWETVRGQRMQWYHLEKAARSEELLLEAQVTLGEDSPWFDGHFPGDPVLPGVAQVQIACDLLRVCREPVRVTGLRRIRFKRRIRPAAPLRVSVDLSGRDRGRCTFALFDGDDTVCRGVLATEPYESNGSGDPGGSCDAIKEKGKANAAGK